MEINVMLWLVPERLKLCEDVPNLSLLRHSNLLNLVFLLMMTLFLHFRFSSLLALFYLTGIRVDT